MHFLFRINPNLNEHDLGCQAKNINFWWQTRHHKQAANSLVHERAFANFSEPGSWRRYNKHYSKNIQFIMIAGSRACGHLSFRKIAL